MHLRNVGDIPNIPDQDERIEEITLDCYNRDEMMAGFYTYFEDAPQYPFEAIWPATDKESQSEVVTVLGVADFDDRRGILLNVKQDENSRRILAEQLWAKEPDSVEAIVLNDYRYWLK